MGMAMLAAGCITNPGDFTITVLPGSILRFADLSGNPTTGFSEGGPECSDLVDNDLDGDTDFAADAECDSADDASERVDGVQAYEPMTLRIAVDAEGEVTVDPADISHQQIENCVAVDPSVWCLGATIVGTGPVQSGSINVATHEISVPFTITIELEALTGFPGLPTGCQIGPISTVLISNNYDTTTGEAILRAEDAPVDAIDQCGGYDAALNGYLGLPGQLNTTLVSTILNDTGDPIAFEA